MKTAIQVHGKTEDSIDRQLAKCQEFIDANLTPTHVDTFIDSTTDHSELTKLLSNKDQYDEVVCYSTHALADNAVSYAAVSDQFNHLTIVNTSAMRHESTDTAAALASTGKDDYTGLTGMGRLFIEAIEETLDLFDGNEDDDY